MLFTVRSKVALFSTLMPLLVIVQGILITHYLNRIHHETDLFHQEIDQLLTEETQQPSKENIQRILDQKMNIEKQLASSSDVVLVVSLITILLSALWALLLNTYLTKPLGKLASGMRNIGESVDNLGMAGVGHLVNRTDLLPFSGRDEFQSCARAFNDLLRALSKNHEHDRALNDLSRMISYHLDPEKLSLEALIAILEYLELPAGAVLVQTNGELEVFASHGLDDVRELGNNDYVHLCMHRRQEQRLVVGQRARIATPMGLYNPREVHLIPIVFKDKALGVMVLASNAILTPSQLWFAKTFCQNFSLALNNALTHTHLQTVAAMDALTQTYNRHFGARRITEEFQRASRLNEALGIIMVDIDHFKGINDRYGHLFGDKVLTNTADMIRETLREGDILIRFGGEEFLGLLPMATLEDCHVVAERIREAVADAHVADRDQKVHVTVSIGVAAVPDHPADCQEDLIKLADDALYQAKQQGRNRVIRALAA
ncbi:MAG: GGDEF domain-containing protein [Magnetococcales bacterium]|nr:GGDEF domain-containing protein [Magnetococcales bacterium]